MGGEACRAEDKLAALLWLLREAVDHEQQQSIVFAATRHHVELLFALLVAEGLACACVYGAMDQVCAPSSMHTMPCLQAGTCLLALCAAAGNFWQQPTAILPTSDQAAGHDEALTG